MARTNNFVLEEPEQSMPIIEKGFKKLLPLKGWGNARDVSKLYESVCEYRAQRLRNDRAQGNETYLEKRAVKIYNLGHTYECIELKNLQCCSLFLSSL